MMCLNLNYYFSAINGVSTNIFRDRSRKNILLMLTKVYPQNTYKYFAKKTEKLDDKYSQPAKIAIHSQKIPKRKGMGGWGLKKGGWETASISSITYCLNHWNLLLLPWFHLSTLKEPACCRIRLTFLFNRRKKEKQRRNTKCITMMTFKLLSLELWPLLCACSNLSITD